MKPRGQASGTGDVKAGGGKKTLRMKRDGNAVVEDVVRYEIGIPQRTPPPSSLLQQNKKAKKETKIKNEEESKPTTAPRMGSEMQFVLDGSH